MEMKTYQEQTSVITEWWGSNWRHINTSHSLFISQTRKLLCREKQHLSESTRCNHKVHPLHSEAPAQLDRLNVTFSCSGEGREEEAHAEGIVDITESIDEGGVPATKRSTSEAAQLDTI